MSLEADNVFRILKGEVEIQPLRCRLGFHRWSKWEVREPDANYMLPAMAKCHCVDCNMPRYEEPYSKRRRKNVS